MATAPDPGLFVPTKKSVILPLAPIWGGIGAAIGSIIGARQPEYQLIVTASVQTGANP